MQIQNDFSGIVHLVEHSENEETIKYPVSVHSFDRKLSQFPRNDIHFLACKLGLVQQLLFCTVGPINA